MFEETEVCIQCGRPVDGYVFLEASSFLSLHFSTSIFTLCPRAQRVIPSSLSFISLVPIFLILCPVLNSLSLYSRAYCSDECESLDSTSPAFSSAASSTFASPYLASANARSNLDVPALVPSALGHRARYSISSASSTAWSAVTEEDDRDLYVYSERHDMPSEDAKHQSGLFYARRPASTNQRSIVPTLHRHTSAASSSASSLGVSRGLPSPFYASTEDDTSSLCISELSLHEDEVSSAASAHRKAKRTSLPAYFSLLQGSSASSSSARATSPPSQPSHARRAPSALHAISRSLHGSPTTPKVSHATAMSTNAPSAPEAHAEPRGRGRRRERDPEARSTSSRRSAARSPPRYLSSAAVSRRAHVDSVEKVAEWMVSHSPATAAPHHARRNSSPHRKPKYEFVEDLTRRLHGCTGDSDADDDHERCAREDYDRTVRGRRRVNELDEGVHPEAPGYGNGRSGLRARERGRAVAARAISVTLR
jgi:hypothetical protein